jgi:hypothetical protein
MTPALATPALAAHPFEGLSAWEWVLVGAAVLAAGWAIWKAVLLTLRPGETDPQHIKRQILEDPPVRPPPNPPRREG